MFLGDLSESVELDYFKMRFFILQDSLGHSGQFQDCRSRMAEIVHTIQTPKKATVSLSSDSTCPTLNVSERAFWYLLMPRSIFYTFEALSIS